MNAFILVAHSSTHWLEYVLHFFCDLLRHQRNLEVGTKRRHRTKTQQIMPARTLFIVILKLSHQTRVHDDVYDVRAKTDVTGHGHTTIVVGSIVKKSMA